MIMLQGCMGEWAQYCLLKLTQRSIYSIFALYIAHIFNRHPTDDDDPADLLDVFFSNYYYNLQSIHFE